MIKDLTRVIPLLALVIIGCSDNDKNSGTNKSSMTDAQLEQILLQRYDGDRTGVCVAAAYIEAESIARATVCANPSEHRLDLDNISLEIGSVTKTMTAALLASLIDEGQLRLEDPLSNYLPDNINVPSYQGEPILLKHLVTHTSGLPREPSNLDPFNPYSLITEDMVLNELNSTTLLFAPGTQWQYSNFGYMLLGYVIANTAGSDLETLMRERIFAPLGMHSYIQQVPATITEALGHKASNKQLASSLDFNSVNLAAIGGVHSTLSDMILFSHAQLGYGDADTVNILKLTQNQIDIGPNYPANFEQMAMAWGITPLHQNNILYHGGDTIGFSSVIAIDPENHRAVVILEDTRLELGRYELVNHLLDPTILLPPPRYEATADESLLQKLQGNYMIDGIVVSLTYEGSTLIATFSDGTIINFGYDSRGDFYPLTDEFGLLTPIVNELGQQTFVWVDAADQLLAEPI